MNIQNLMAQLTKATNPMAMMMSMLNPSQKELISQFQSKSGTDQAQAIADFCNKNGITKDKLQEIIGMLNKK